MIERDLAALSGEPRKVRIAGRELRVRPYTPRTLGKLTAWLKDNAPHPLAVVKPLLRDTTPAEREALTAAAFKEARESWPPTVGSPAATALLGQGEGLIAFLGIALAPTHPELGPEDLEQLAEGITFEEYGKFMLAVSGQDPEEHGVEDPNGRASAT